MSAESVILAVLDCPSREGSTVFLPEHSWVTVVGGHLVRNIQSQVPVAPSA